MPGLLSIAGLWFVVIPRLFVALVILSVIIVLSMNHDLRWPEFSARTTCLVFAAVAMHFLAEPMRWSVYSKKGPKGFFAAYPLLTASALLSYLFPAKLGLPTRFLMMTRFFETDKAKVAAYMATDSALSLLVWMVMALVLSSITSSRGWTSLHIEWNFVPGLLGAAVLALLIGGFFRLRSARGFWGRCREQMSNLSVAQIGMIISILILDIASYVWRHWVIFNAFSIDLSPLLVAAIAVVSITAGFLSLLPMGLVGYDLTLIFLLTHNHVGADLAMQVALVNRLAALFVCAALGIPSLMRVGSKLGGIRSALLERHFRA